MQRSPVDLPILSFLTSMHNLYICIQNRIHIFKVIHSRVSLTLNRLLVWKVWVCNRSAVRLPFHKCFFGKSLLPSNDRCLSCTYGIVCRRLHNTRLYRIASLLSGAVCRIFLYIVHIRMHVSSGGLRNRVDFCTRSVSEKVWAWLGLPEQHVGSLCVCQSLLLTSRQYFLSRSQSSKNKEANVSPKEPGATLGALHVFLLFSSAEQCYDVLTCGISPDV